MKGSTALILGMMASPGFQRSLKWIEDLNRSSVNDHPFDYISRKSDQRRKQKRGRNTR